MEWMIIYKWSLVIVYAILLYLYARHFIVGSQKLNRILSNALGLTLVFHLSYLIFLTRTMGHVPFSNVFEMMTSYVFIFVLIYFVIELRIQDKSLGVIIILIAWLTQIVSNIFIDITKSPAEVLAHLSFYEWHVFAMVLAYSGFTISFISSLMYVLLSREIQKKKLGFFFSRLPSLELMDRLSNMAVAIGVSFITIGIILGIIMASKVWGAKWPFDPKLIAVFITWLIYVVFIYFRNFRDWQGNRAAVLSIFGFVWIVISVILFSTIFSGIHSFI
ncbi:hypothetical protein GF337_07895 [candidate division KSB1 bacterium]|nr:hypothetical protein [candidate division KSB1 bacterium]